MVVAHRASPSVRSTRCSQRDQARGPARPPVCAPPSRSWRSLCVRPPAVWQRPPSLRAHAQAAALLPHTPASNPTYPT